VIDTGDAVGVPAPRPAAYAVWEITLRCNLKCIHCGSRAGPTRDRELTTDEALEVVEQLAEIGITEVTLIGGEAYLRQDWETIAAAIRRAGMWCTMTSGGWGITPRMAARVAASGITNVSVSVDGLEATHDHQRGRPGSWRWCFDALTNLEAAGVGVGVNTQLNRLTIPELPRLYPIIRDRGIDAWQVQLTGPMGRAADEPELIVQPAELPVAYEVLGRVASRAWADGVVLAPSFNIGYYGPHERLFRGGGAPYAFWQGPDQGLRTIGIESDGTVKAELTLPTELYRVGNVLDTPLRELLDRPAYTFALDLRPDDLWGFCGTCEFGSVCLGGDPWMTRIVMGRHGNNPYCEHRALALRAAGRRERVEPAEAAAGDPYDCGRFDLVEEDVDAPWPAGARPALTHDEVVWPSDWVDPRPEDLKPVGERGRGVDVVMSRGTPLPRERPGPSVRRVGQLVTIKRRLDQQDREAVNRT